MTAKMKKKIIQILSVTFGIYRKPKKLKLHRLTDLNLQVSCLNRKKMLIPKVV